MRYLAKVEPENAEMWIQKAITEAPNRREALVEMALHYYNTADWPKCYKYAKEALVIKEKPLEYLCEEFAWGATPWDLLAISSYRMGNYQEAFDSNLKALEFEPKNERLITNHVYYEQKISS
jgi:tetratricopeptide (TPR) repeat protein